jgi:hypothetical protein
MHTTAPWFVGLILQLAGVLLIATGIPLARRRVPPNMLYGVRFAYTLSNGTIWYEINARCGRHLIAIGLSHLVILNTLLLTGVRETETIAVTIGFVTGAVLLDVVILFRAAIRLAQRYHANKP